MKYLIVLSILLQGLAAHAGPSPLTSEFQKYGDSKIPSVDGLSYEFLVPRNEGDDAEDDLFADVTGLLVGWSPLVFGALDKYSRYINLEPSSTPEVASPDTPYLLIENNRWDLSLGLQVYTNVVTPLASIGVGVSVLKGKNYFSVRKLNSKDEDREALELPLDEESLKNWRVGDQLFYAARGGVAFNLFLLINPVITVGPEYVHQGTYRVHTRLVEEKTLELEITTTKTDSIAFETLNLIHKWEKAKGQTHLNNLIYRFDLNHKDSFKAINYFYQGRLDLVNNLMLSSKGAISVKSDLLRNFSAKAFKYGIPFIIWISAGSESANTTGEVGGKRIFVASSSYERFSTGLFSHRRWLNSTLKTTIVKNVEGPHSLLASAFTWQFSKDKMQAATLLGKIAEVNEVLDEDYLEELELPQSYLGNARAEISLNFTAKNLMSLMDKAKTNILLVSAKSLLLADFKTHGHKAFCPKRSYSSCLDRYNNYIEYRYDQIRDLVADIEADYSRKSFEELTEDINDVLGNFLESKYLLRALKQSDPSLKLQFTLEGENIKYLKKAI